jgi:hypothetical protein
MEADGDPDKVDYDGDLGYTEEVFVMDANFIKGQVGKRARDQIQHGLLDRHVDQLEGKVNLRVVEPLIPPHANLIQPLSEAVGVEKVYKGVNVVHASLRSLLVELDQGKHESALK